MPHEALIWKIYSILFIQHWWSWFEFILGQATYIIGPYRRLIQLSVFPVEKKGEFLVEWLSLEDCLNVPGP